MINRAAYYPGVTADITASQGNDLSRIGAGDLPASRLFDREAEGVQSLEASAKDLVSHGLDALAGWMMNGRP